MDHAAKVFERAEGEFRSLPHLDRDLCFTLAGLTLRLKFASAILAEKLTPVFAHLQSAEAKDTDLTILCWDQQMLGESAAFDATALAQKGPYYAESAVKIFLNQADGIVHGFDERRKLALYRVPDARRLPVWEQTGPFRPILHWWTSKLGLLFLHAAAVGIEQGGVVLVGSSGSGKSTTALATVGSKLKYAGDDYCIVDPNGYSPMVYSVFSSGKADKGSLALLPRLAESFDHSTVDQLGKSVISMALHFPEALILSFPLRGIVAPRISNGMKCNLMALTAGEVMQSLAPSTLFQLQGDRATSFSRMTSLARNVPAWGLMVGKSPDEAQSLILSIIQGDQWVHEL